MRKLSDADIANELGKLEAMISYAQMRKFELIEEQARRAKRRAT